jgi:hypothetical protein
MNALEIAGAVIVGIIVVWGILSALAAHSK